MLAQSVLAAPPNCSPQDRAAGSGIHLAAPDTRDMRRWSALVANPAALASDRIQALLERAATYRRLGHYRQAGKDYAEALQLARAAQLPLQQAIALLGQGELAVRQRRYDEALSLLNDAAARARLMDKPVLTGSAANALGDLQLALGHEPAAAKAYRQALAAAKQAEDPAMMATAWINLAQTGHSGSRLTNLGKARAALDAAPPDQEKARLLLRLAYLAKDGSAGRALARASLTEAIAVATQAGLAREQAEALALTSELATDNDEARRLLLQAIQIAPFDAYDLRYQWEWRLAKGFQARGDRSRALAAYRRAVGNLEKIRDDIPIEYAQGRSSFRETLEPLYLSLADLLLREAAVTGKSKQRQQLLREARDTVEQLKIDELRDYFRDACIAPLRQQVDVVDQRTAVLYPVLFADRLELILSARGRMTQQTVVVEQDAIELAAQVLALKLRYAQPIDPEAGQLYDWLIRPIESALHEQRIETLVFVPDGALRTVPPAVLRNDQGYLIERYALAVEPGLQLLQPKGLKQQRPQTLLAGLSRPGPVVEDLPVWWVSALVQQHRRALGRGGAGSERGVSVPVQGRRGEHRSPTSLVRAAQDEKVEALSLPGVENEINGLSRKMPGTVLRNQDFLLTHFVNEVEQNPYRIVHIASHGLFQGPPEQNFIVTYDRKLDMERLAAALRPRELDRSPIELLVLSACQTAEGDDRTPLGLSGVALQSGARSALGSLWPVGDAATQELMQAFYDNIASQRMSKAQALQAAQKTMIQRSTHKLPSDWGAFILVGNWL